MIKEDFMNYVHKTDSCWLWTGSRKSNGYGEVRINKTRYLTHRFSYQLFNGPLINGKIIMHSCDIKHCVNPAHLSQDTYKQNSKDCVDKGKNNPPIGERQGRSHLNEQAVKVIKYMHKYYNVPLKKLAKLHNVDPSSISLIVNNKNWKHIIVY